MAPVFLNTQIFQKLKSPYVEFCSSKNVCLPWEEENQEHPINEATWHDERSCQILASAWFVAFKTNLFEMVVVNKIIFMINLCEKALACRLCPNAWFKSPSIQYCTVACACFVRVVAYFVIRYTKGTDIQEIFKRYGQKHSASEIALLEVNAGTTKISRIR